MPLQSTADNGANQEEDGEGSPPASRARTRDTFMTRLFALLFDDPYKPEKHYMRGPGPKAKAKANGHDPVSSVRPTRAKRGD
jgi:hypothetical protein